MSLGQSVWLDVAIQLTSRLNRSTLCVAVAKPQPSNPKTVYTCGAGHVTIRSLPGGIRMAAYAGVIGAQCFDDLRQNVLRATLDANVLILDMTAMLSTTVLVPPVPTGLYPVKAAPGVVICREDQIEVWQRYADNMADLGIMRIVFLDSERDLARSVANSLADA